MEQKKLLIVEDNRKLSDELATFFRNNNFEVNEITEFENVVEQIKHTPADLILLDLNLPRIDGFHICREMRNESDIPIIIITSRDTEIDELVSMNSGADDFVTKPFNTQILLARVQNIFKRMERSNSNRIHVGDFVLDTMKSSLFVGENELELTKNEFRIIYLLVENRGSIVSRDAIMDYLWDGDMFVDDNALTVNINRLRKKLEDMSLNHVIETKRGQGYIIK